MPPTAQKSSMTDKAAFVIDHLRLESNHLDSIIESSLEMQQLLRQRRTDNAAGSKSELNATTSQSTSANMALQAERNQRLSERLNQMRTSIAQEFIPVLESRRRLVEVLNSMVAPGEETPSVSSLVLKLDDPYRGTIKSLRNEIRGKLNQVQSINMGNQAVLVYTLDFYNRLLTGLSQDQTQSNYYNAMGQSQNTYSGSLVRTNC